MMKSSIGSIMQRAADSMNRGDDTAAIVALTEAKPLLEVTEPDFNEAQSTVFRLQAAHMAMDACNRALALEYATLLMVDVTRKLHGLYDACVATKNIKQLVLANLYARTFIPFLPRHVWVDQCWREHASTPSTQNFAALMDLALQTRPQLDAARWELWDYPKEQANEARYWTARVVREMGQAALDEVLPGRSSEDAQGCAESALTLLKDQSDDRSQLLASDAWSLLGRALMSYGDPRDVRDQIIAAFETSLEVQDRLGTPQAAATDRSNLAAFYFELGRFAKAGGVGPL